jgi:hypothetical protein
MRTLERAKREMGIKAVKNGQWYWRLPDTAKAAASNGVAVLAALNSVSPWRPYPANLAALSFAAANRPRQLHIRGKESCGAYADIVRPYRLRGWMT